MAAAAIGVHIGVGEGFGVLSTAGDGLGVGKAGVPAQMATLISEKGDGGDTMLVPPPPPPQLHMNAKPTDNAAGTTTRHLRNHSIEH
jgi:hypothetical protein